MFKCKLLVFLFYLPLFGCVSNRPTDRLLLDVQKACSENMALVEKLMVFNASQFDQKKPLDPKWGFEQIWDLQNQVAVQYNLQWLQLRFQDNKLQALWFGPRSTLDKDLVAIGLRRTLLRNEQRAPEKDFIRGTYYSQDLNDRKLRIDHKGGPEKGTTVTCFPSKRF